MVQRASQPDLSFLVQDHLQHFLGMPRANRDHDLGIDPLKTLQKVRQEVDGDGMSGRDLQRPRAGGFQLLNRLRGQRCGAQQLFRVRTQNLSGFRQSQTAAGAGEETSSERFLEGLDAGAYRRLTDTKALGCAVKATEGGDCEESLDLVDFHVCKALLENQLSVLCSRFSILC